MREIEAPANIALINATLARIANETRLREIREAAIAHANIKPRYVTAPIAAKNATIILVAFGLAALIAYEVITVAIEAILGAFGQ